MQLRSAEHNSQNTLTSRLAVKRVHLSKVHGVILTDEGRGNSYAFGVGKMGRLGMGDEETRLMPNRIPFTRQVIRAAVGLDHTLLVDSKSDLYAFGSNHYGQLCIEDEYVEAVMEPVRVMSPRKAHSQGVLGVAASAVHSVVWLEDMRVFMFGLDKGQFGKFKRTT